MEKTIEHIENVAHVSFHFWLSWITRPAYVLAGWDMLPNQKRALAIMCIL
jgi:hypothetical protein